MKKKVESTIKKFKLTKQTESFQKPEGKFNSRCPLSVKNAPVIDYKNVSLLKNIFQKIIKFCPQK